MRIWKEKREKKKEERFGKLRLLIISIGNKPTRFYKPRRLTLNFRLLTLNFKTFTIYDFQNFKTHVALGIEAISFFV